MSKTQKKQSPAKKRSARAGKRSSPRSGARAGATKARAPSRRPIDILLSNDDGINSPGLQALARALAKIGRVTVVAPEREQSTMGHALTLHKPVRLFHVRQEKNNDQWALSGTPADCVYMGIRMVLKKRPDIIVSGINFGVNLGNDIFYSGTIAAAREGAVLNIPAIATSLDAHNEPGKPAPPVFDEAAKFVAQLVLKVLERRLPSHCLLNVNFPHLPFNKIKGVKVSRQGFRMYTDVVAEKADNRGKPYYWLGGKYAGYKPIEGSDCEVLDKGYISITPCRIDVTQYDFMEDLSNWELESQLASGNKKAAQKARAARGTTKRSDVAVRARGVKKSVPLTPSGQG